MVPNNHGTARLAADLIARYGDDAIVAALERADAMVSIGNADAAEVWAAVTAALQRRRGIGPHGRH